MGDYHGECRRDPSLQQQHGENARSMVLIHTVLEVYRVQDMSLVRMLPSADDEINTALFHPFMVGLQIGHIARSSSIRHVPSSSYLAFPGKIVVKERELIYFPEYLISPDSVIVTESSESFRQICTPAGNCYLSIMTQRCQHLSPASENGSGLSQGLSEQTSIAVGMRPSLRH